jgi:hypothetical protein
MQIVDAVKTTEGGKSSYIIYVIKTGVSHRIFFYLAYSVS